MVGARELNDVTAAQHGDEAVELLLNLKVLIVKDHAAGERGEVPETVRRPRAGAGAIEAAGSLSAEAALEGKFLDITEGKDGGCCCPGQYEPSGQS